MLEVILGSKDREQCIKATGKKFIDYNDGLFDTEYTPEWLEYPMVAEILYEIDHIDKMVGRAFHNYITGDDHSQVELSTGCKTLILMIVYKDFIFQSRFGDNCLKFVERMALERDITLVSDYLHAMPFELIKKVHYVNYGIDCESREDLLIKIEPLHYRYDHLQEDYDYEDSSIEDFPELLSVLNGEVDIYD